MPAKPQRETLGVSHRYWVREGPLGALPAAYAACEALPPGHISSDARTVAPWEWGFN